MHIQSITDLNKFMAISGINTPDKILPRLAKAKVIVTPNMARLIRKITKAV